MSEESKPPLIWVNLILFSSTFLISLFVVPYYAIEQSLQTSVIVWTLLCFAFCNLSITAGYHRLWSHKTYQANFALRLIFALGGAFALQNSILHWSSDHRVHHKHVDNNDKDPYSAKRGFWFSHIGWMLRDYNKDNYADYSNCRDLQKDPIVVWQHKYYLPLALITNIGIPVTLGFIYQDIIGMVLFVGILRLVLVHHTTFFVNSLAHIWGRQTYTDKNSARDNGFLALFTFGEGYHNFHHIFENDYRNGIRWWDYDPTKWLIKGFSYVGLTTNLRKTPQILIEKARLKMMLTNAEKKTQSFPLLQTQIQDEFERIIKCLEDYYSVKKQMLGAKRTRLKEKYEFDLLVIRKQQIQVELNAMISDWRKLSCQAV
ncbi:acyl-CoA desaturase [Vibrio sonorensis]|uniref:acyl-CoA desaturase n=1 Tax=Vibrio sonorensis TaxID=1004316 RepID=UPI0008DAE59F|nr:fatty acid desaturase [Vibrio sonorensis]